jgi:anti-sigma factor RsiW
MNEEMLHAYLDGELSPADASLVEQALASDAAWAAEYERLVAVQESLDLLPAIETRLDGAAILRRGRRRRTGRILRMTAPLAAAAAALALLLVPRPGSGPTAEAVFSVEEQVQYLYWESDAETYGSGDLSVLEDDIVEALEPS